MSANIRAWLASGPLFIVYHALRQDGVLSAIRQLEASQWLDADKLKILQQEKLRGLLTHAVTSVPYYRRVFGQIGLAPDELSSHETFRRLPCLTKEIIRANMHDLTADGVYPKNMVANSTSGSTGEPMRFYNDKRSIVWQQAVVWRNQSWVHALYSDREARLWGAQVDVERSERLRQRLHGWLHQKLVLSSYDLSDASMASYADRLSRFRPRLLISYPGALATFCQYLEQRNMNIPGLEAVITSAEQLHDWQRELIQRVLGVPVFDRYGCREFGNIAHECDRHEGYHVNMERFLVEILDENGDPVPPGQSGGIYITDLDNYAFPFIRYAIGDRAVPSAQRCSCGRGLALIERFEGRVLEVVRCPNGNRLGGTFWTITLRMIPGLRRFQVEQIGPATLVVRLVMPDGAPPVDESAVRVRIAEKCGTDMDVRFEYVDAVPTTRSGKERLVIAPRFD